MIRAKFCTDDCACVVEFDVTGFFELRTWIDGSAAGLPPDWLGDLNAEYTPRWDAYGPGYASDRLAEDSDNDKVQAGLRHCCLTTHDDWLGEPVGFEVSVNAADLDRWMQEHGVPWDAKTRPPSP